MTDKRNIIDIGIKLAASLDDIDYDVQKKEISESVGLSVSALNKARQRTIKAIRAESRTVPKSFLQKVTYFDFFEHGGYPKQQSDCTVYPDALLEFDFVNDVTWGEFIRVTKNHVHYAQAWLQVVSAGWPENKQFEFRIAYKHVFKQYLSDIIGNSKSPTGLVYWPSDSDAAPPYLCKLKVYAAGDGRFMNNLFRYVSKESLNNYHVALAAGYTLDPGFIVDETTTPPKIIRDKQYRWPLITGHLAPGYREIIPSRGLLVHRSKDPKRLNAPYIESKDVGDWLAPVRASTYRPGEPRHEYIPGRFTPNSIKKKVVPVKELMLDLRSAISTINDSFPSLPVDALAYQICRGMINEIDESVSQAFLFMVGTSGAGKTQITRLAGEILGAETCVITLTDDITKGIQRLGYAFKNKERFICLDEFHMLYQSNKQRERTQITRLLQSLSRRYRFDAKYKDDETVDSNSVVVMTGTTVPSDFASKQLGRRTLKCDLRELPKGVNWLETSNGIIGWRCRNKSHKYSCDLIISRIFDFLCHPDIDFNHLKIEKTFKILRLNVIDNPDTEARENAYATLYKIWKHSYLAKLYELSTDEDNTAFLADLLQTEWGDSDWVHPDYVMGSEGWLNMRHPMLADCQIIENIFSNLDSDAHPRQVVSNFRREEGEESFMRLFGFESGTSMKLLVRRKGSKICAKWQFWKDDTTARNMVSPVYDCPELDEKWDDKMSYPPAVKDRIMRKYLPDSRHNYEDDVSGWTDR